MSPVKLLIVVLSYHVTGKHILPDNASWFSLAARGCVFYFIYPHCSVFLLADILPKFKTKFSPSYISEAMLKMFKEALDILYNKLYNDSSVIWAS